MFWIHSELLLKAHHSDLFLEQFLFESTFLTFVSFLEGVRIVMSQMRHFYVHTYLLVNNTVKQLHPLYLLRKHNSRNSTGNWSVLWIFADTLCIEQSSILIGYKISLRLRWRTHTWDSRLRILRWGAKVGPACPAHPLCWPARERKALPSRTDGILQWPLGSLLWEEEPLGSG